MKLKIQFFLILFLILLFGYIGGIYLSTNFLIFLSFYSLFFYVLIFPFKKIKNKELRFFDIENLGKFAFIFSYRISILIIILFFILGSFAYYQNKISPALMPTYYITNGKQKIIFQAMSHIASPGFYYDVKSNLEKAKKDGYVLYYEGVLPGSKESSEKFDKALGVKFDKDLYKNMSKLYGLVNQDNSIFVYSGAKNVDLTMDEIIKIYEKNPIKNDLSKEVIDLNPIINSTIDSLNPRELEIIRFLNKAIMNMIIKNGDIQDFMIEQLGNKALMDTILQKRNINLVNAILQKKDEKIFITYGLLHFKGVFELLQKNDPNWKIEKVEYLQVVR